MGSALVKAPRRESLGSRANAQSASRGDTGVSLPTEASAGQTDTRSRSRASGSRSFRVDPLTGPVSNYCKPVNVITNVNSTFPAGKNDIETARSSQDYVSPVLKTDYGTDSVSSQRIESGNPRVLGRGDGSEAGLPPVVPKQKPSSRRKKIFSGSCIGKKEEEEIDVDLDDKLKRTADPKDKTNTKARLTAKIDNDDQDVSRDARTPSPPAPKKGFVKVIVLDGKPRVMKTSVSSPVDHYDHSKDAMVVEEIEILSDEESITAPLKQPKEELDMSDAGATIIKSTNPAPFHKGEKCLDLHSDINTTDGQGEPMVAAGVKAYSNSLEEKQASKKDAQETHKTSEAHGDSVTLKDAKMNYSHCTPKELNNAPPEVDDENTLEISASFEANAEERDNLELSHTNSTLISNKPKQQESLIGFEGHYNEITDLSKSVKCTVDPRVEVNVYCVTTDSNKLSMGDSSDGCKLLGKDYQHQQKAYHSQSCEDGVCGHDGEKIKDRKRSPRSIHTSDGRECDGIREFENVCTKPVIQPQDNDDTEANEEIKLDDKVSDLINLRSMEEDEKCDEEKGENITLEDASDEYKILSQDQDNENSTYLSHYPLDNTCTQDPGIIADHEKPMDAVDEGKIFKDNVEYQNMFEYNLKLPRGDNERNDELPLNLEENDVVDLHCKEIDNKCNAEILSNSSTVHDATPTPSSHLVKKENSQTSVGNKSCHSDVTRMSNSSNKSNRGSCGERQPKSSGSKMSIAERVPSDCKLEDEDQSIKEPITDQDLEYDDTKMHDSYGDCVVRNEDQDMQELYRASESHDEDYCVQDPYVGCELEHKDQTIPEPYGGCQFVNNEQDTKDSYESGVHDLGSFNESYLHDLHDPDKETTVECRMSPRSIHTADEPVCHISDFPLGDDEAIKPMAKSHENDDTEPSEELQVDNKVSALVATPSADDADKFSEPRANRPFSESLERGGKSEGDVSMVSREGRPAPWRREPNSIATAREDRRALQDHRPASCSNLTSVPLVDQQQLQQHQVDTRSLSAATGDNSTWANDAAVSLAMAFLSNSSTAQDATPTQSSSHLVKKENSQTSVGNKSCHSDVTRMSNSSNKSTRGSCGERQPKLSGSKTFIAERVPKADDVTRPLSAHSLNNEKLLRSRPNSAHNSPRSIENEPTCRSSRHSLTQLSAHSSRHTLSRSLSNHSNGQAHVYSPRPPSTDYIGGDLSPRPPPTPPKGESHTPRIRSRHSLIQVSSPLANVAKDPSNHSLSEKLPLLPSIRGANISDAENKDSQLKPASESQLSAPLKLPPIRTCAGIPCDNRPDNWAPPTQQVRLPPVVRPGADTTLPQIPDLRGGQTTLTSPWLTGKLKECSLTHTIGIGSMDRADKGLSNNDPLHKTEGTTPATLNEQEVTAVTKESSSELIIQVQSCNRSPSPRELAEECKARTTSLYNNLDQIKRAMDIANPLASYVSHTQSSPEIQSGFPKLLSPVEIQRVDHEEHTPPIEAAPAQTHMDNHEQSELSSADTTFDYANYSSHVKDTKANIPDISTSSPADNLQKYSLDEMNDSGMKGAQMIKVENTECAHEETRPEKGHSFVDVETLDQEPTMKSLSLSEGQNRLYEMSAQVNDRTEVTGEENAEPSNDWKSSMSRDTGLNEIMAKYSSFSYVSCKESENDKEFQSNMEEETTKVTNNEPFNLSPTTTQDDSKLQHGHEEEQIEDEKRNETCISPPEKQNEIHNGVNINKDEETMPHTKYGEDKFCFTSGIGNKVCLNIDDLQNVADVNADNLKHLDHLQQNTTKAKQDENQPDIVTKEYLHAEQDIAFKLGSRDSKEANIDEESPKPEAEHEIEVRTATTDITDTMNQYKHISPPATDIAALMKKYSSGGINETEHFDDTPAEFATPTAMLKEDAKLDTICDKENQEPESVGYGGFDIASIMARYSKKIDNCSSLTKSEHESTDAPDNRPPICEDITSSYSTSQTKVGETDVQQNDGLHTNVTQTSEDGEGNLEKSIASTNVVNCAVAHNEVVSTGGDPSDLKEVTNITSYLPYKNEVCDPFLTLSAQQPGDTPKDMSACERETYCKTFGGNESELCSDINDHDFNSSRSYLHVSGKNALSCLNIEASLDIPIRDATKERGAQPYSTTASAELSNLPSDLYPMSIEAKSSPKSWLSPPDSLNGEGEDPMRPDGEYCAISTEPAQQEEKNTMDNTSYLPQTVDYPNNLNLPVKNTIQTTTNSLLASWETEKRLYEPNQGSEHLEQSEKLQVIPDELNINSSKNQEMVQEELDPRATFTMSALDLEEEQALPSKILSSERINTIKKQIYEEGLKPASRDGGVSFFIPVSDAGLQPPVANVDIQDRLAKPKRPSLSYEERMLMADINRHQQLSKKKEFAVKDLINVKAATSSSASASASVENASSRPSTPGRSSEHSNFR